MSEDYKRPTYDVFGYCINCGKYMIVHEVIDGIHKQRFTGDYTNVSYLLNDGSQMRVAMCKSCAEKDVDLKEIMGKVWRGWQHEVETYSQWTDERKKDYLDRYKKKAIVSKVGNMTKKDMEKKLGEFKEKDKEVKVGKHN